MKDPETSGFTSEIHFNARVALKEVLAVDAHIGNTRSHTQN